MERQKKHDAMKKKRIVKYYGKAKEHDPMKKKELPNIMERQKNMTP